MRNSIWTSTRGAVVVVLVALLAGTACGDGKDAATTEPEKQTSIHRSIGLGDPSLTTAQKLDRLIEPPRTPGLVRGVVMDGGTAVKAHGKSMFPTELDVFTDYAFKVTGWVGHTDSPYRLGSTITLRVPGGHVEDDGGLVTTSADGQGIVLNQGMALYVVYTDHGDEGGGNAADRIVAVMQPDIWPVSRDGKKVEGTGPYADFSEPVSTFEAHFKKR